MQPAAGISALSTETGVRGVIARGGAGALVPELVMGHAVILTGAVRDEGTSFHYLPAGRVVSADPGPAESLADALSAAGVETPRGLSWSTDAIYRETRARGRAGWRKGA